MQNISDTNDRTYRAPREHGTLLSVPALNEAGSLARENQRNLNTNRIQFAGLSFADYRQQARNEILDVASRFTAQFAGETRISANLDTPIFVTGHQPQFTHPGVWAKNLAVSMLARDHAGIGLNLVVDNDVVQLFGVQVPDGTTETPHFQTILFDDPQTPQPWEEVRLRNKEEFSSFSKRVQQVMERWDIESVIGDLWPAAIHASSQCDCTILPLTVVRAKLERHFGLGNLELPVSSLCETTAFLQFAIEIIAQHERFFESYNEAVHWYRATQHIKNDRHPVPDLERQADRYELPFWFWKQGDQQRERVFVNRQEETLEIFAGNQLLLTATQETLLDQLKELQKTGKLRTRALTTTMFARLAIADLFVHGIGGAKYDEITDRIIAKFFRLPVPTFLTLTATFHLPVKSYTVSEEDRLSLQKRLRELHFNADQYLDSAEVEELKQRKQALIAEHNAMQTVGMSKSERLKLRPQNRKRHFELKAIQEQLRKAAADRIAQCRRELQTMNSQLKANSVLKSREFAAVLYPERSLKELLLLLENHVHEPD